MATTNTVKNTIKSAVASVDYRLALECNASGSTTAHYFDFPELYCKSTDDTDLQNIMTALTSNLNAIGVEPDQWDLITRWNGNTPCHYAVTVSH